MFDYLQKFNNLPKELRDKVSSKEVMAEVLKLETKFGVDLAALVMKVMIKTVPIKSLAKYIASEFSLGAEDAKELSKQLFVKIFSKVSDYLGINDEYKKNKDLDEINNLINQTNISLASSDLIDRLKNIIFTYKKGVRDKVNTRLSLLKEVEKGGLGLTNEEADSIFKVIDRNKEPLIKKEEQSIVNGRERLDKIIKEAESSSSFYDLKKSIEQRKKSEDFKKIEAPDEIKNLPLEEEELSLPLQEKKTFFPKSDNTLKSIEQKINLKDDVKENKVVSEKEEQEVKKEENTIKSEIEKEIQKLKTEKENQVKEEKTINTEDKKNINNLTSVKKEDSQNSLINKKITTEGKLQDTHKETKEDPEKKEELKENIKEEKKSEESNIKKIEVSSKIPVNPNFKRPAPGFAGQRPVINDIRAVPKTMNPIEELKFLNIKNFRRLGDNPTASCERVLNKIKLLERDGYDKMIEGIKAWHASEVNQLYIKIGRESILSGKKMREIVVERQKNNLPVLKEEEIQAIANLNSKLVF